MDLPFLSYLVPQTVTTTSSKYNREIKIIREFGHCNLYVNGVCQSGQFYQIIWDKIMFDIDLDVWNKTGDVLLLGIGGGSAIGNIRKHLPGYQIEAVDIDAKIISLGRKYFHLDKYTPISLRQADAREYVNKLNGHPRYCLIIVDLFIGNNIPDFVITNQFLDQIRLGLIHNGLLIVNYGTNTTRVKISLDKFIARLQTKFGIVKMRQIDPNFIIYATRT